MLKKMVASFAVLAVGFIWFSEAARASDRDMLATTVPATACEPVNSFHASKVRLVNAAWVFNPGHTGWVWFYCPVPRNAITQSNTSNDNDISAIRTYYRDSDGTGTAARVTSRLLYRQANGLYSGGTLFNSNSFSTTGNTSVSKPNPHDVRFGALYSFWVTLYRGNTSVDPAFSGIDFWIPPVL